jgi:hypothetical protein
MLIPQHKLCTKIINLDEIYNFLIKKSIWNFWTTFFPSWTQAHGLLFCWEPTPAPRAPNGALSDPPAVSSGMHACNWGSANVARMTLLQHDSTTCIRSPQTVKPTCMECHRLKKHPTSSVPPPTSYPTSRRRWSLTAEVQYRTAAVRPFRSGKKP